MKAALLKKPGKLEVEEIPVPHIGPDEALVRVKACGICGSDLRYFRGANPWAKQTLGVERPNPPNMVLGHEFGGEVVDTGQRVVVLPFKACGVCFYCRRGEHHLCGETMHIGHSAGWQDLPFNPGGYAELCPVWKEMAYPLPDSISFEEATFLDGLAVAVHAVRKANLHPGDEVAILGSGPIGLLILLMAKAFGAKRVIATDIYEKPLKVAQELGADILVNIEQTDAVRAVSDVTSGLGVQVVFNTVGTEETVAQSLQMLSRGGRVVLMAGISKEVSLDFNLLGGERAIITSANYLYPDFQKAIDLLESGKAKISPIITHRFGLVEIAEAFQVMENKREYGALKVLILP